MRRVVFIVILNFALFVAYPSGMAQDRGGILLPPPPIVIPPPAVDSEEAWQNDLLHKRERRRDREKPVSPAKIEREKQQQALFAEAGAEKPRAAYFDISLLLVRPVIHKNRSDYIANPTSHFQFLWRQNARQNAGKSGPFYGFRLAPFSGSGRVSGVPGSFGLTYFGPAIGIGKFDIFASDYSGLATDPAGYAERREFPVTSGWIVSAGLSAQSRIGTADNVEGTGVKEDIVSKGLDFDSPGIWIEGRIAQIHYGATGYSTVFGLQSGRGKIFLYLGAAAIALY